MDEICESRDIQSIYRTNSFYESQENLVNKVIELCC